MAKRKPMSKAETEVARVLWEMGSATARQIHENLKTRRRKIDYTTVQTYMSRLEEKGYVTSQIEGRAKLYTAKASPTKVVREAVDEFVKNLFDGNALPLLQHLIQERGVDSEDVKKLREMLDEMQNDQ